MKFDFDRLTDRRGTFSYKWQVDDGELPMWVADMDFETAPAVKSAIERRAAHGIFGYSDTPDVYFSAFSSYFGRRHGFALPVDWLVYSSGVVAAVSSAVRRLTHPGEGVVIQAPVYNIFYNSILNNGRRVVSNDLVYDGVGYSINFDDLEQKLSHPTVTMMILCNPHNPVGRIWSREELIRIGELCHKHGVAVFSDEVHCDLTLPGVEYTPFAAASELCADISVNAYSVSKSFNLAGLQSACLAIKNPGLRNRIFRGLNNDEVGEPNCFAMCGAVAALTEGDEWLDALRAYLAENRRLAEEYIAERIPSLCAVKAEATYLLWIDAGALCPDSAQFCQRLRAHTGLYLSDGREYGECSAGFIRMNLATQRERVKDGLARLENFVNHLLSQRS